MKWHHLSIVDPGHDVSSGVGLRICSRKVDETFCSSQHRSANKIKSQWV